MIDYQATMEAMLTVIVILSSGEIHYQEHLQPTYESCKIKEGVYHYRFAKRQDLVGLITSCGKQYRIIYWRQPEG